MKIQKALNYAIAALTKEIETLENALETKNYSIGQRNILEEKLKRMKIDLTEFHSISI
ncbi:hypothetical protein [Bacillus thuringiensis]|uniref:hypothetical protein n=1 Tax=Bacillus thuringiensis TaxID=1428 RepID=UPI0021D64BB8|nr:hypothetical protein [Bacillus thuringiensis]MCU7667267.1 hypothetical protein [Bacillus thuringiensis]